jgi:hypothetical protein
MLSKVQKEAVKDGDCAREDFMFAWYCKLQKGTAEGVTNYSNKFFSVNERWSRVFKAGVDEIKTKENLSDIIDIIELSVKVFALQELAELIEHEQSITWVRLFDSILSGASRCIRSVGILMSCCGFFEELDVSLFALKRADWVASVFAIEICWCPARHTPSELSTRNTELVGKFQAGSISVSKTFHLLALSLGTILSLALSFHLRWSWNRK